MARWTGLPPTRHDDAHIVVYVTDGDLNRSQHQALTELLQLQKPLILVLNKTDRYNAVETAALSAKTRRASMLIRIWRSYRPRRHHTPGLAPHARRQRTAGERAVAPQVQAVSSALQRMIDGKPADPGPAERQCNLCPASEKLDEAIAATRQTWADELIDSCAVKAVIGALAAITPGRTC